MDKSILIVMFDEEVQFDVPVKVQSEFNRWLESFKIALEFHIECFIVKILNGANITSFTSKL